MPRRLLPGLALLLALAGPLPAQTTPASPGVMALALLDLAREQGLEPRLVDVRWDADVERLHCLVAADVFPLEKATPFLLMASGRSTISREEVGRRIEFPVSADGFRPRPGPGAWAALATSLGDLEASQRRLERLGDARPRLLLQARVARRHLRELFLRASQIEGRAAWTTARLEVVEGGYRVTLEGPGAEARASSGEARSFPSWVAASAALEGAPPPARLVEGPDGDTRWGY